MAGWLSLQKPVVGTSSIWMAPLRQVAETWLQGQWKCFWQAQAAAAFDVVLILQRACQAVSGCEVALKADRASEDPKVFTKINLYFTVKGKELDQAKVERAVKLSHEKYCSATTMLAKTAELTYSVEVISE